MRQIKGRCAPIYELMKRRGSVFETYSSDYLAFILLHGEPIFGDMFMQIMQLHFHGVNSTTKK
jgi:hypothetical protein